MNALLFLLLSLSAFGAPKEFPQIGEHHPLFVFEKNENPENIMVVYVKLNESCQFVKDPRHEDQPFFDFYWLMDREKFKPTHPLIKSGIRKRLDLVSQSPDQKKFVLKFNDMDELKPKAKSNEIHVTSKMEKESCKVQATMNLASRSGGEVIQLKKIHSHSKKIILPPFRKLEAVTFSGVAVVGNEERVLRFISK